MLQLVKESIINIRTATIEDAKQIAFVHIDSWRTTYSGILTEEYLDKLNLQEKTNYWIQLLTKQSDNVFVAVNQGEIVGFASAGESREENGFDSEVYAIYVLQQHQQKNIGRLLMTKTAKYLQNCGYNSIYVWVLADNSSKQFYKRLGGEQFDKKEIEINGQQLIEIAYGWRELNKLITT